MADGLGDTIEWITVKTGIKKIISKYWDCDCDGRRKKLNKTVPYKKNVPSNEDAIRVMEEQLKGVLTPYKKWKKN